MQQEKSGVQMNQ